MEAESGVKPGGHGWLIVLLGLLAGIGPFAIDTYLPALPAIGASLHASASLVQASVATYFIGLALGQIFYGPLADRLGRRAPLLLGLGLFIMGALGCMLAQSAAQLVAFRLVQALGGAAEMVVSRAVVRDRFAAKDAAKIYSTMMLISGLAPMVAPLLGGWLLAVAGWRAVFGFLVLFGVTGLVSVFFFLPESLPEARRARHGLGPVLRIYGGLLGQKKFLVPVFTGALIASAMFSYIAASPFVFMQIYHVSPRHFGLFFGANALGITLAGQLNRLLLRYFSMPAVLGRVLVVAALAGLLVALSGLFGWGGFAGLLVPLFVVVSSLGLVFPNTTALALAPFGQIAGNASALLGVLQFVVGGVAVLLLTLLNDGTARPMGLVIAACTLGALAVHLARPNRI